MQEDINMFEKDLFPNHPKILFIGLPISSHTHSWMGLLEGSEFNVRLFGVGQGLPPDDWSFPTYITDQYPPPGIQSRFIQSLYPLPEDMDLYYTQLAKFKEMENGYHHQIREFFLLLENNQEKFKERLENYQNLVIHYLKRKPVPSWILLRIARKVANIIAKPFNLPSLEFGYLQWAEIQKTDEVLKYLPPVPTLEVPPNPELLITPLYPPPKAESAEAWLATVIKDWRPDIIHTLGLFDGQGGEFYYHVRKENQLENIGKWILQLRGGSDLTLRYKDPEQRPMIKEMFEACDQILSDNLVNPRIAREIGISESKFAPVIPVPGTGGIDIEGLRARYNTPPSKRQRILLVSKSYDVIWSKVTPVFEAIYQAWPAIKPCKIIFTAATEEAISIIKTFPPDLLENCSVYPRLNRNEFIELLGNARVILAPSLIDGIPNILYEAMATGTFPIVSPLETIKPVIQDGENTLFARNLYPEEIAEAIIRAMNEDCLVDNGFHSNLNLVYKYADRRAIRSKIIDFYHRVASW